MHSKRKSFTLNDSAFLEGAESIVSNDDMVEKLDAEKLAAFVKPSRDRSVFGTRSGIAGRMIVDRDHRAR